MARAAATAAACLALAAGLWFTRADNPPLPTPIALEAPQLAPEPAPPRELFHTGSASAAELLAALRSAPEVEAEATVRGWVHDEDGELVDGAGLTAERGDIEIQYSDEDGSFVAHGPPGSFALIARADGRLSSRLEGLVLSSGEEVRQVVLTLQAGLSIEGRVLSDEEPLVGTHLTVSASGYLRSAFSDDDGRFIMAGLPAGPVTVTAFDDSAGTASVETNSGDRDVVLRPRHDGKVTGIVLDAQGQPVEGAMLFLDESDPLAEVAEHDPYGELPNCSLSGFGTMSMCGPMPGCLSRTTTDSEGHFVLEVGSGARATVVAMRESDVASATTAAGQAPLELRLAARERVRFRALDANGAPVAATISMRTERSGLRVADQEVETGADGEGVLEVTPGVPMSVEGTGVRLEFAEGVPPNLTVTKRETIDFD